MDLSILSMTEQLQKPLLFLWCHVCAVLSPVVTVIKLFMTLLRLRHYAAKFPVSRKPLPILGNIQFARIRDRAEVFAYAIKIGLQVPLAVVWMGIIPVFYVTDPRDMERILANPDCQKKPSLYYIIESGFGAGLITISGDVWKRHHKIIAPTFHTKVLDSFVAVFNSQVDVLVDLLGEHVGGQGFDVLYMLERLSLDIICETAMGINMQAQTNKDLEYLVALNTAEKCLMMRLVRPWLYPEWMFALSSIGRRQKQAMTVTRALRDRVIRERRLEVEANDFEAPDGKKRRLAFLDHLLLSVKAGAQLSDKEIADEVDTFMAAGEDTTSMLLAYAFYELARNPDVQEKAYQEVESLYDPSLASIDVSPEDLSKMAYLEMALKETLRLHPAVPLIGRLTEVDVKLASRDLVIPAGAHVAVALAIAQWNPEYFPDPMKYDPDRFLPENVKKRHPYAFIPFSVGQRSCIGRRLAMMEAKVAMTKVLFNYRILPEPGFEPKDAWGVVMKPVNGVRVRLERRVRRKT